MFSIKHACFDDIVNIKGRLRIARELQERRDIYDHAATLISLQDGDITAGDINLDLRDRALGRYMGSVMGNPEHPEDEKAPIGTKLPPYYPSPLYHLMQASLNHSPSCGEEFRPTPYLPKTVNELEVYLHEAMHGVFRNDKFKDDDIFVVGRIFLAVGEKPRFEQATGVTIRSLAEFLFAIRKTHPALFLLFLSFEIEEIHRTMPFLDYRGGRNAASEWRDKYFKKSKCSILAIIEIIRILRRGTAIIEALSVRLNFTVGQLRCVLARLRKGVRVGDDKDTLMEVNLSVFALRKIGLVDIDRHDAIRRDPKRCAFYRRNSDKSTLRSMTCLGGPDTAYAADVLEDYINNAVMNLPDAGPPPQISSKNSMIDVSRIAGAGKIQNDQLCTFYGLTGKEVAILVAIEVGAVLGDRTSTRSVAELASVIVATLWTGVKGVWSDDVHRMKKTADHVFPAYGKFRHSCGFARSSWSELEGDAIQWRALTESSEAKDPADPYAELFLATRRYMHGFSVGFARLENLAESARIFCHQSHSMGLLAQDPVWIRLVERARFIAGINIKNDAANNNQRAMFGSGPKCLDQMVRSIV